MLTLTEGQSLSPIIHGKNLENLGRKLIVCNSTNYNNHNVILSFSNSRGQSELKAYVAYVCRSS
jgi:hypothetical protein